MFALCSQLIANELSPSARKQGFWSFSPETMVSQTVISEAKNSKTLFLFWMRCLYLSGISQRHANPS